LQPAQIEEVFLYPRLGRAIVLVKEDQLSLAIGRRGQNVRLGSKLVGWDIEIMTHDELNEGIERAENWFRQIPGVSDELVEVFIEEGFLSYDDLTFLEPAQLAELAGCTEDQAEEMIAFAEEAAARVEEETKAAKASDPEEGPKEKPAPTQATPGPADIFPVDETTAPEEPKPTVESLFGSSESPNGDPTPQPEGQSEAAAPHLENPEPE
jgi:N utilization substance protein A